MRIINGDTGVRELLAAASIDLIITSPPYNLGVAYQTYQDVMTPAAYMDQLAAWLANCLYWLKDDGRLCLNVPLDKHKHGNANFGAQVSCLACSAGFQHQATVIWRKGAYVLRPKIPTPWRHEANAKLMSTSELVLVLYKRHWRKTSGSGTSDLTREEFRAWSGAFWSFMPVLSGREAHPAPFPEELPHRCVKLFSYVGDTVLDPFMGSGTTLVAAARLNRVGVGIEMDREYCKTAYRRLQAAGLWRA